MEAMERRPWLNRGTPRLSPAPSPEQRFWEKVDKSDPDGCWPWLGGRTSRGYPVISINTKAIYAHRFAMELDGRPLGPGEFACHTCDTPACVRASHLFAGDVVVNAADMVAKGRSNRRPKPPEHRAKIGAGGKAFWATHERPLKSHCPQGHSYDAANTVYPKGGGRKCRICVREYVRGQWYTRQGRPIPPRKS